MTPGEAARRVAEGMSRQTHWNYDHVECVVLHKIAEAFESFAEFLERPEDDE